MTLLTRWALRARLLTLGAMALVLVAGLYSLVRLQVELLPDVDFPLVTITAVYPQADAQAVVRDVTQPVEKAITGMKGLQSVRSTSAPGFSLVLAQFEFGADMKAAERDAAERLRGVSLPRGVQPPRTGRVNPDEFPILTLSVLSGPDKDLATLHALVNQQVLPGVRKVPGVFSAEVPAGSESGASITRTNGVPSLAVNVLKEPDANTVAVSRGVVERLGEIKKDLPAGVEFVTISDQGPEIQSSVDTLTREVLLGAALAVLVIFGFLLSARPTLVTAMSIPVSIFGGLIVMRWQGMSLNIVTLGALAIAVGRVVDDSIVVMENIYRHIQRGEERAQAALTATREVAAAITTSTLTTIAVFAPLGFIGGIIGAFFLPFALTITYALLASLLVALTVVPVLGSLLIQPGGREHGPERPLHRLYVPSLRWALGHKGLALVGAAAVFVGSLALLPFIPLSFLPGMEQNVLTVQVNVPPGTPQQALLAHVDQVEAVLAGLRRQGVVESYRTTSGANGDFFGGRGGSPTSASTLVRLAQDADRSRIAESLRQDLAGTGRSVAVAMAQTGGPQANRLELVFLGEDYNILATTSGRVAQSLKEVPGLTDVRTDAVPAFGGAPPVVSRVNGKQAVTVTGTITAKDTRAVNREVTRTVQEVGLPQGVTLDTGGVFADIADAFRRMGIAMAIGVALVYMVMAVSQRSLTTPLIILFSLPLASIGALGGLFVTQHALGVTALLGILMLIGLVVTNAIVLIAFVEQLRRRGLSVHDALVEGGRTRMRPILMTAFTTSFALLPLATIVNEGSGIIGAELATVVIGGLMTSTLLTLVVIPVVYRLFRR
ncbi:MAG: efflux RND transporter permease subunit, partial [Chloroflexi bacterium]|nr:efflux RND transporter permease subunit [Chloroflexota bacterium]